VNRSIVSKIVEVDEEYVTIETVEVRPRLKPLRACISIEHNGNPEEVHRGYHDLIAGKPSECTKADE
jgi:hypothetical protein